MSDPEIVMSPLCQEISKDGTSVQVDIFRCENEAGWIAEDDIRSFLDAVPEEMH